LETERWAFMRYAGQGWEIPVRLDGGPFDHLGGELLANRFEKAYEEFFGRAIAGLAIEAIGWSVRVATRRPPVERVARLEATREVAIQRTRAIHDAGTDTVVEAAVVERDELSPGDRVAGPAVIVEPQTTTWVSSNREVVVQADGCLLIIRNDAEGPGR
jgi:N-methylhydantoinase A